MSVEYGAVVVLGLPYHELENPKKVVGLVYEDELSRVAPYYDADAEDCTYGVIIARPGDYSWKELELSAVEIAKAHERFTDLTGQVGRVFISVNGH